MIMDLSNSFSRFENAKFKTYSYYSIINTYKDVFKNTNNEYKKNVSFDEIYALFEVPKIALPSN